MSRVHGWAYSHSCLSGCCRPVWRDGAEKLLKGIRPLWPHFHQRFEISANFSCFSPFSILEMWLKRTDLRIPQRHKILLEMLKWFCTSWSAGIVLPQRGCVLVSIFYINYGLTGDKCNYILVCMSQIDLKKMPLGKLSKKQIESAYRVLTELQQVST